MYAMGIRLGSNCVALFCLLVYFATSSLGITIWSHFHEFCFIWGAPDINFCQHVWFLTTSDACNAALGDQDRLKLCCKVVSLVFSESSFVIMFWSHLHEFCFVDSALHVNLCENLPFSLLYKCNAALGDQIELKLCCEVLSHD